MAGLNFVGKFLSNFFFLFANKMLKKLKKKKNKKEIMQHILQIQLKLINFDINLSFDELTLNDPNWYNTNEYQRLFNFINKNLKKRCVKFYIIISII